MDCNSPEPNPSTDIRVDKATLEQLVGLGLSDAQISERLTGGRYGAWWSKENRLALGVLRRKGGAQQVTTAVIDPLFSSSTEEDSWFERVRHGEADLFEVMQVTGCSYQDVYWRWRGWSACRSDPLESAAMRRARSILSDIDADVVDKCRAVFGRRLAIRVSGGVDMLMLDGERVRLTQLVALADDEARELGLPSIGRDHGAHS